MNNFSDLTVLVVEDVKVVRDLVAEFVNSMENISVIGTASTIKEAIDCIVQLEPDIVILDISLPNHGDMRSGIDVLKWTKKHYPATDVIMFSSHSAAQMRKYCLASGAYAYLEKAIAGNELTEVINRLVRERTTNHKAPNL